MKIFSKRKYIKDMCKYGKEPSSWAEECDGQEVINGHCKGYSIHNDWCYYKKRPKKEE
jgi:hypothetical protein